MTIKALEGRVPRIPADLRCRLAEMVNRRPENSEESTEDCNEMGELLPLVHYVDDGLSLFKETLKKFESLRAILLETKNLYQLIITNHPVDLLERSPELSVATLNLNMLRTSFSDQLCNNSPLIQERLNAVRTLSQDLPELLMATRQFSTTYSHPVLDSGNDVTDQVFAQLQFLAGNFYHRQYYRHCLNFPRKTEFSLLLPDETESEVIPTMGTDYCWPVTFHPMDALSSLNNSLDDFLLEGTGEALSQCIALQYLTLRSGEISKRQREEFPKIKQAWERVVEQVRLLLFITDSLTPVLEAALDVIWLRLEDQLAKGEDHSLEGIVEVKLLPLLNRVSYHE